MRLKTADEKPASWNDGMLQRFDLSCCCCWGMKHHDSPAQKGAFSPLCRGEVVCWSKSTIYLPTYCCVCPATTRMNEACHNFGALRWTCARRSNRSVVLHLRWGSAGRNGCKRSCMIIVILIIFANSYFIPPCRTDKSLCGKDREPYSDWIFHKFW